jgi:cytochrome c556
MGHSTDIVGYTYCADIYCPRCMVVETNPTADPEHWESFEAMLDASAYAAGIDRYNEATYDSGDFPKVIFRDMIEETEHCGNCHDTL